MRIEKEKIKNQGARPMSLSLRKAFEGIELFKGNIILLAFNLSIFLLFTALQSWIARIYFLNLATLSINESILLILLLLTPVLVFILKKRILTVWLYSKLHYLIITFQILALLFFDNAIVFALFEGISVALLLIFLPFLMNNLHPIDETKISFAFWSGIFLDWIFQYLGKTVEYLNDLLIAMLFLVALAIFGFSIEYLKPDLLPVLSEEEQPHVITPKKTTLLLLGIAWGALIFLFHSFIGNGFVLLRYVGIDPSYGVFLILIGLFIGITAIGFLKTKILFMNPEKQKIIILISFTLNLVFLIDLLFTQIAVAVSLFFWVLILPFNILFAFKNFIAVKRLMLNYFEWLIGMIVYLILILSYIFTLTYDYVPLGGIFRNLDEPIILFSSFLVTLPLLTELKESKLFRLNTKDVRVLRIKKLLKQGLMDVWILMAILALIFVPQVMTAPTKAPTTITEITVLTYNIQQGFTPDGKLNARMLKDVIQKNKVDIIGLQESDTARPSSGNIDIVWYLEKELRYYAYYGPKSSEQTFGIALLSRFPLTHIEYKSLPSRGEQTMAIYATAKINNQEFNIVVTHFGEYDDDKLNQANKLVALYGGKNKTIVLGDFNSKPGSAPYTTLSNEWTEVWPLVYNTTIKKIDHIFVSADLEGQVTTTWLDENVTASDHAPLFAKIKI